jgi:protein-disulfide isomerase
MPDTNTVGGTEKDVVQRPSIRFEPDIPGPNEAPPVPGIPPMPGSETEESFFHRWGGVLFVLVGIALTIFFIWFGYRTSSYIGRIQSGEAIDPSEFGQSTQVTSLSSQPSVNEDSTQAKVAVSNFEDDPSIGPKNAKVTIVMFEDFECPFCGKAFPVISAMIRQYSTQVRFVYRDFPVSSSHANAQKAAEAGQCAHDQGKFWEFHDQLFSHQDQLAVADLKRHAQVAGLNVATFTSCLDSGKHTAEVEADFADGLRAGVSGTPTFFFNGEKVQGVLPAEGFHRLIEYFSQ